MAKAGGLASAQPARGPTTGWPPRRSDLNGHLVGPDDVPLPVVLGLDARNCYLAHYPFSRLFVVCKCNSETSRVVSPEPVTSDTAGFRARKLGNRTRWYR